MDNHSKHRELRADERLLEDVALRRQTLDDSSRFGFPEAATLLSPLAILWIVEGTSAVEYCCLGFA